MNVIEAVSLAARLHGGQVDKLGEPYLGHLVRVMLRLPDDASDHERLAALLHDVIEEVPDGARKLAEAGVPARVIDLVAILTRREDEDYDAFVDRVAATGARRVKRADIEDNSDPARLARLPAEMRERLLKKYARAIGVLKGAEHA
jgi:(p)ppGpp synthase/HD superfamily hydrolase